MNELNLYENNIESYKKVKDAYDNGNDIVSIVHATGTGKSYNALQLALLNPNKKIVYIVPSNSIIKHIKEIINEYKELKEKFSNIEFRNYQSLVNLNAEEISNIECDLLILDEFHHLVASVWGARINTFIDTYDNIKIFGMTAYTVRDRGTICERDMALEDGYELFSDTVVSRYDLCDAIIDEVLPKPIYRSIDTKLLGLTAELERKVKTARFSNKEKEEYLKILTNIKRQINNAPGIEEVYRQNIKPTGKYLYFCPPGLIDGTKSIDKSIEEVLDKLNILKQELGSNYVYIIGNDMTILNKIID